MDTTVKCFVILCSISYAFCAWADMMRQIDFMDRQARAQPDEDTTIEPSRRLLDLTNVGHILGSPSMASHLPEAEPILPGHTLIRPALGMLKSSIKFPHRELENGAGVYGSFDNLGIRYDGRNERILYSGFRRSPADYIVVAPVKSGSPEQNFVVSSVVLDLDKDDVYRQLLRNIKNTRNKKNKRIIKILEPGSKRNRQKLATARSHQRKEYPLRNLFVFGNSDNRLSKIRKKTVLRQNFNYDDDEEDDDVGLDDNLPTQEPNVTNPKEVTKSEEKEKTTSKSKWFWDSKNLFNHIKIHQDAPEFTELMPENVSDHIRTWWFYHQDDYQPFHANEVKEKTEELNT